MRDPSDSALAHVVRSDILSSERCRDRDQQNSIDQPPAGGLVGYFYSKGMLHVTHSSEDGPCVVHSVKELEIGNGVVIRVTKSHRSLNNEHSDAFVIPYRENVPLDHFISAVQDTSTSAAGVLERLRKTGVGVGVPESIKTRADKVAKAEVSRQVSESSSWRYLIDP